MTVRELLAQPEWRIEGRDKVTGAARYAADASMPGMLYAAFAVSPYPHARLVSVDVARARTMPGVRAVLTGADVRPAAIGRRLQDWPVLAWDRVRLIGDRVAAVAADTQAHADAAALAVEAVYEELPAIFTPADALRDDAPILHPDRASYRSNGESHVPVGHPNIQGRLLHEHGDVAAGFASAARIFEHEFQVARVVCGYVEPRATLVWIEGETVHVVSTHKGPFTLRKQMALSLDLPEERIVVEPITIGGDFGGKGLAYDEHVSYFLAKATGRPIHSVFRYADELQIAGARRGATLRLRTGVDADGRITAHQADIVYDGGAYAAAGPGADVIPGNGTLLGYRVPAARLEAIGVFTNTMPGGSSRAPGQPQLAFAAESHMDAIARALGADPFEFRERNLAKQGELDVNGTPWHGSELPAVLEILRRESRWGTPLPPGRGRGMAIGVRHIGRGRATMTLTLARDGSIEVLTGLPEQGTGSLTAIQRIIASELGLDAERVRIRQGDTAEAADDPGHGGSKSTPVHGSAALDGARKLAALLAEKAPGRTLDQAAAEVGPLVVTGAGGQEANLYGCYAEAIEVSVDVETGALHIEDALVVVDTGTVINPVAALGQIEGGFVMGLGAALMEEVVVEEGQVATTSLGEYKLPTMADVPPLRVVLHTTSIGPGPYGSKSVGELSLSIVGAAIANAVDDAVGVRLTAQPFTPEKTLGAIQARRPR